MSAFETFGDPAFTSQRPETIGDMTPSKHPGMYLDSQGRKWYRLRADRFPAGQMLFAKILKPVIPTCDIISQPSPDGKSHVYYSYVPVLGTLHRDESFFHTEKLLSEKIFKDPDRIENFSETPDRRHRNHYDFELSTIFFMHPTMFHRTDIFFTTRIAAISQDDDDKRFQTERMGAISVHDIRLMHPAWRADFDRMIDQLDMMTSDEAYVRRLAATVPEPLSTIIYFPPETGCAAGDEECFFQRFYGTLRARIAEVRRAQQEADKPASAEV